MGGNDEQRSVCISASPVMAARSAGRQQPDGGGSAVAGGPGVRRGRFFHRGCGEVRQRKGHRYRCLCARVQQPLRLYKCGVVPDPERCFQWRHDSRDPAYGICHGTSGAGLGQWMRVRRGIDGARRLGIAIVPFLSGADREFRTVAGFDSHMELSSA